MNESRRSKCWEEEGLQREWENSGKNMIKCIIYIHKLAKE